MAKGTHFIIYDSVDVGQAIKIYEICVESGYKKFFEFYAFSLAWWQFLAR